MSSYTPNQTLTPYIVVKRGHAAIEFYSKAFHAKVLECHETDDNKIMHARLQIGDSSLMISDEFPERQGCGMTAPKGAFPSHVLHLYTEDVDAVFNRAIEHGAKEIMPVEDMFWGDRYGQLEDPFGHRWSIATPLEDK